MDLTRKNSYNPVRQLYKAETGSPPLDEIEYQFTIFRSKGQWVIDIDDMTKFDIFGSQGNFEITMPDTDYIEWLEQKLTELLKLR